MYGAMPMPWGMPYGMPMPGSPYGPSVAPPDQRREGYRSDGRRSDTTRGGRNRRGPVHPRPSKSVYQPDPDAERPEDSKPCRTLFVRNVAFEVNVHQFREQFEQFGEIKTWFDLIQRRGLLFVTFFDTRAAQRAKEEMNQRKLYGRVLDVHYSLPKDEDQQQHCDREKNQGTLFALVRGAKEPVTDESVRALFAPFGEIREIRPYKDKQNTRFIEYWDSRACVAAYDQLNETSFLGGELLLKFAWDLATVSLVTDAKNRNEAKAAAEARAREGRGSATPAPAQPSTVWPAPTAAAVHGDLTPSVPGPTGDRLEQAQKVQQVRRLTTDTSYLRRYKKVTPLSLVLIAPYQHPRSASMMRHRFWITRGHQQRRVDWRLLEGGVSPRLGCPRLLIWREPFSFDNSRQYMQGLIT